jgi:hypothetical protein
MDHVTHSKNEAEQAHDAENVAVAARQTSADYAKASATATGWAGTVRRRRRVLEVGAAGLERGALNIQQGQKGIASRDQSQTAAPILLVTGRRRSSADLGRLIGDCGHTLVRVNSLDKTAQNALGFRLNCMIVDLDSCGSLVQVVDALITLREERPNLIVVALSKQVKRDDFSLERLAMCDVTLRLPATPEALEFALQEAQVNNRVWVMRCRQTKLESVTNTVAMMG